MKPNWRRAYHEMFWRSRSMLRDVRANGGRWVSDEEIDRRAWRDAAAHCERAINIANEDGRSKQRQGMAA